VSSTVVGVIIVLMAVPIPVPFIAVKTPLPIYRPTFPYSVLADGSSATRVLVADLEVLVVHEPPTAKST
jgi:hypothetical protein